MADVVANIDGSDVQRIGGAYVVAGPKVQEGDANRTLETAEHSGLEPTNIESKYTNRLAVD